MSSKKSLGVALRIVDRKNKGLYEVHTIMNNAYMSIGIQISVWNPAFSYFGYVFN